MALQQVFTNKKLTKVEKVRLYLSLSGLADSEEVLEKAVGKVLISLMEREEQIRSNNMRNYRLRSLEKLENLDKKK
jgi:nicotinamide mononucleotide (NMN) deamidase PncC